jgi:eukaryotic-like serine/threonine-protein kinase
MSDLHEIERIFTELSELGAEKRQNQLEALRLENPEIATRIESLFLALDDASSTLDQSASIFERVSPLLDEAGKSTVQIDRYEILSIIGRGGMGTVYHAIRNDTYRQEVAIKVLHPGLMDSTSAKRFEWERQVLARIKHPGVARIMDGGTTKDGNHFYVMELVEGLEMRDWLSSKQPNLTERLLCLRSVAEAVAEAHRLLIIHRDIKPANVRIDQNGQPKLLDFGIAKQIDHSADSSVTITRSRVYSPEYAAPEQIRGDELTTAVDIYGLGMLMYIMLAGGSPYETKGKNLHDVEQVILNDTPKRMSSLAHINGSNAPFKSDALIGDLDAIALKAIRKEPELRYASVQQFIDDIDRFMEQKPVLAREGSTRYRLQKFMRRNKLAVIGSAMIIVLILGLSLLSVYTAIVTDQKNREIIAERDRAQAVSDFMLSVFRSGNPFSNQDPNITARQLLEIGTKRIDSLYRDNPDLALYMKFPIASAFRSIGMFSKADSIYAELLHDIQNQKPNGSIEELSIILDIAIIRDQLGDYKTADSLFVLIQEKARLWGLENDPKVIEAYAEHAISTTKQNKPIDVFQQQLLKNIETLKADGKGGSYPHITTLMALGSSYYYTDPSLGLPFLEEADSLFKVAGLGESSITLMLTNNLALFYQNSGNIQKADQSYKKLLFLIDTYMSDNISYSSLAYTNYATFLKESDLIAEALVALQKAYDIQQNSGSPIPYNMFLIYGNYGILHQELGNHSIALDYFDKTHELGLTLIGEEHEFMAMLHTYRGISMAHMGKMQDALDMIDKGVQIRLRSGGEQNWYLGDSEYALSELALIAGKYMDAITHLRRSIALYRSIHPADQHQVMKSTDRLIDVYGMMGDREQAENVISQYLKELEEAENSNAKAISKYRDKLAHLVR